MQSWQVGHVKRETNRVAHRLAKEAVHLPMEKIWVDCFPDFIRDHVLAEVVNIA